MKCEVRGAKQSQKAVASSRSSVVGGRSAGQTKPIRGFVRHERRANRAKQSQLVRGRMNAKSCMGRWLRENQWMKPLRKQSQFGEGFKFEVSSVKWGEPSPTIGVGDCLAPLAMTCSKLHTSHFKLSSNCLWRPGAESGRMAGSAVCVLFASEYGGERLRPDGGWISCVPRTPVGLVNHPVPKF